MKKIIFTIIALLLLGVSTNVYASGINVSISGDNRVDANGDFWVNVSANCDNVFGVTMNLSYDSSKIELIGNEGQNGFTATVGSSIVLDSTSAHNGNISLIKLKFKAKSTFEPGQSTTISVSNVKGASDSEAFNGNNASFNVTVNVPKSANNSLSSITINGKNYQVNDTIDIGNIEDGNINIAAIASDSKASVSGTGTKKVEYGNNTYTITVTAENGSTKNYIIKVNKPDNRSTDNTLSSLTISPASIKFNKNTTNYSITVEHSVSSIEIVAKASDSKANVTGTGTKKLNDYINTYTVTVTAENGSKKNYVIKIIRKDEKGNLGEVSKDNSLKSLTIEGYDIEFVKETLEYSIEVENIVTSLVINATVNHEGASVEISGNENLKVGNNVINIKVTAESGDVKNYIINVNRKKDAPVTTLLELNNVINNVSNEAKEIIVEIKDINTVLTKEILEAMKKSKKIFIINNYSDQLINYSWTFDGSKLNNIETIDTSIKFTSDNIDKINNLTNYANLVYLNFNHNGKLPAGTKVKVYVGDKFKDKDIVNVYYYNNSKNKMENIKLSLEVENGYIEFELDHCSEYIVTQAVLNNNIKTFNYVPIICETILLVGLITLDILKINPLNKINIKNKKSISKKNNNEIL